MVGENIKKYREMAGIKQVELANAVGVSQAMIAMIERGTKTVSLPLAKEIAKVLGVSVEDL